MKQQKFIKGTEKKYRDAKNKIRKHPKFLVETPHAKLWMYELWVEDPICANIIAATLDSFEIVDTKQDLNC